VHSATPSPRQRRQLLAQPVHPGGIRLERPSHICYGSDYAEAGADYYDRPDTRNRDHLARHYQQALARLGYQVTLTPPGERSPPPEQAA
jgi:hypothetical protein